MLVGPFICDLPLGEQACYKFVKTVLDQVLGKRTATTIAMRVTQ
jgi:hypothetical protein